VTPEEFLADVAVVFAGDATQGAFGSGRLIAPGLVLTAGHVVDYPTRQAPIRTGWKVRLVRERAQSGAWIAPPHEAELVWRGSSELDLALLRLTGDEMLAPTVKPVFASYHSIGSIDDLDAAGFPQAWFAKGDTVRDYTVRGSLRIATQYGPSAPYAWSVPSADKPDDPHGWKGMSGAAVCKVGSDQELHLFGTVQEVPANFSGGLLEVAHLSAAFADDDFCNALRVSLGYEPPIAPWIPIPSPGPSPSVQAPAEYVDRPELTQPLLAHLLSDHALAGRTMISAVHGLGGIGKTTIARWLVWQPEIAQRFRDGRIWVTLGREPPEALTIINDWVSQLAPEHKAKATLEAARSDLTTCLQNRSVLFVIDDVWPRKSAEVAKALLVASSRSCFLLTTRFSRLAGDARIMAKDFPLDQMSLIQAKELITRILGRELRPDEACDTESVCTIVGGHPLALELAAARIKEGRSWTGLLSDLSAEIAHLDALEKVDDELIEPPIADNTKEKETSVRASLLLSVAYLNAEGQRLFAWLGVISANATITPKMAATFWATDEETALRHLRSLSGAGMLKAEGSVYRMHDLMHDLARGILTAPVIAPQERDIPGLGLTLPNASRQLLERYRTKTSNGLWHTLPEDGYIHDHLVQLIEQANWKSEVEHLLWEESADGYCGWYWARERLGQTAGFIADVNQVWSYGDRTAAAATTGGDRAKAVALQLHCALIITSINSLSAGIPIEVLEESVRRGLITFPTALTLARQNPDARSRVSALLALAAETPIEAQRSVLVEALSAARGIDDRLIRAVSVAAIAPLLPPEEALVAARGIDDNGSRARALAAVAERLPRDAQPNVLGEALSAAHDTDHAGTRAEALALVSLRLPPEEALVVARSIDDDWRRAEALTAIVSRLPPRARPNVLSEALSAARDIHSPGLRAPALAAVAALLPAQARPSAIGEALSAARSTGSPAQALADIAEQLREEAQPALLGEALSVARGIDDAGWRTKTLADIAPRLPPEEALVVARSIDDIGLRAKALAEVARRLPPETQPSVIEEALGAVRISDDAEARARALAAIAERLPAEAQLSMLGEALSVARGIADASSRARVLAEISPRLLEEVQPSVLGEALSVARGIADASSRAGVLAEILPRLPAEVQASVLGEALSAARGIVDGLYRFWALTGIARRLPAEAQPSVLGEALSAARGIDAVSMRAEALAELAKQLPAEAQPAVLGEALSVAYGIDDAYLRAQTLAAVAPLLPPEEALMVARGIDDVPWRARALWEVSPLLPPEEGLMAARDIDDAYWRARALADIASRLSPEKALMVAREIDGPDERAPALAAAALRLPAEAQPNVLREALSAARDINDAESRARALVAIAPGVPVEAKPGVIDETLNAARSIDNASGRAIYLAAVALLLPPEEGLKVARGIADAGVRASALAAAAPLLSMKQITDFSLQQWTETVRVVAMQARRDCVGDFVAILPLTKAIAGETAISNLGRSIIFVGRWWPSVSLRKITYLQHS
jgi:NB-ARC domain